MPAFAGMTEFQTFYEFVNFDGFVKSRILAADDRFYASFGKLKPTLIVFSMAINLAIK
jgi:hypothetical protein